MKVLETLKFSKWWHPKIGTGVFTWLLFSVYLTNKVETDLKALLLFGLLILLGVLGHLINDASDYEQDKKVGKNNLFNKIEIHRASWIITIFTGVSIFLSFQFNHYVCYLTILQILFNGLYSFRPIRLKEKGWWAVIITGFYERTIPYTIILFWLIIPKALNIYQLLFLIIYFSWAYLWECRNYINGQANDTKNDIIAGVHSLIIREGKATIDKAQNLLMKVELLFLSTWMLFLLYLQPQFFLLYISSIIALIIIHKIVDKEPYYTNGISDFLDFSYSHLFITSILITCLYLEKIDIFVGIILILIFQSNYAKGILITYFNWIITYSVRLYYFIFGIGSFIVNHTIHYFRQFFK